MISDPKDSDQVRAWRNTWRYRRMRAKYLAANPLCVECQKAGLIVGADQVDHVKRAVDAPDLFWDTDNWQGLCKPCHQDKTARENANLSAELAEWAAWASRFD